MLRILVCCAGGMSSGILAKKLQKDVDSLGLHDKVHSECISFGSSWRVAKDFDIAMCCPHQRNEIPKMMQEHGDCFNIPVTVIAPRLYGTFRAEDIITDAVDIIELYKKNPVNPIQFPGEDNPVMIQRSFSHRRCVEKKPNNIEEALAKFEAMK